MGEPREPYRRSPGTAEARPAGETHAVKEWFAYRNALHGGNSNYSINYQDRSKAGIRGRRLDPNLDGLFSEADARPMAAATELLAALRGLMDAGGDGYGLPESDPRQIAARAAIAKATDPEDRQQ